MNGRELIAALCGQENVIVIRRPFVAWLGHVSDALLLDQAMYWQDRAGDGEWWHQSDEDMSDRICVPVRSLKRSRVRLIEAGLIETVRKGIPPRIHYRVDLQAVVDGLSVSVAKHGQLAPTVLPTGLDSRANRPRLLGQLAPSSIDEGGVEGVRKVKTTPTSKALTPQPPTRQAGNPGDQVAERTVPTRGQQGNTTPSRAPRSGKTAGSSAPAGESEARGGRWAPVAAAIMAAIGRPAPRGKLPSWLGNAVATFGAAAGDDPAAAMVLVAGWTKSRPLREALERGIVRDHTVPAMVGSWIAAGNAGQPPAGVARKADPADRRMREQGAPDNWRELVYTHDGTKRSPVLALPRLGLEPYAPPASWPAWYREFEGVSA